MKYVAFLICIAVLALLSGCIEDEPDEWVKYYDNNIELIKSLNMSDKDKLRDMEQMYKAKIQHMEQT